MKGISQKYVSIYGLVDPDTGTVQYVGKSKNPKARFSQHICQAKKGSEYPVYKWLTPLVRSGRLPELRILETCLTKVWEEREQFWISHFGRDNLCNRSDGGTKPPETFATMGVQLLSRRAKTYDDTRSKGNGFWSGANMHAWRLRMNFTQQSASEAIGCSRDSVKEWEMGVRLIPKYVSAACSAVEAGIAAEISKPSELCEWRESMGWSKRKAAAIIGVERETLRIWENNPDDKMIPVYIGLTCTVLKKEFQGCMADVPNVVGTTLSSSGGFPS